MRMGMVLVLVLMLEIDGFEMLWVVDGLYGGDGWMVEEKFGFLFEYMYRYYEINTTFQ